jgi:hypothetical protein
MRGGDHDGGTARPEDAMKRPYLYPGGRYPAASGLCRRVQDAAEAVSGRLRALDPRTIEGVDAFYRKRFLETKVAELELNLTKYAYHLIWILTLSGRAPEEVVLVDHGGGTGLQGLLARQAGVGTVIYNDIDERFLPLARGLAVRLGLASDLYVLGDVDALVRECGRHGVRPTALVSYDVIEHIYDIEWFLHRLSEAFPGALALVMSSGANLFNLQYVATTVPQQMRSEREHRKRRREILAAAAPALSAADLDRLVRATRRLARPDIEAVVAHYVRTRAIALPDRGRIHAQDLFGTATCRPDTGFWEEHFIVPTALRRVLAGLGFEAEIRGGFYWNDRDAVRRALSPVRNALVRGLGPFGLAAAPYYTVMARRGGAAR